MGQVIVGRRLERGELLGGMDAVRWFLCGGIVWRVYERWGLFRNGGGSNLGCIAAGKIKI